jgi:CubicO group peptidase (beta-lactamase class C family)
MEKLGRIVAERIDSGRGTGIAAGVVLADGRTGITTHGDAGQGSAVHDNTVFEIGSITKLFTATRSWQSMLPGLSDGQPSASRWRTRVRT